MGSDIVLRCSEPTLSGKVCRRVAGWGTDHMGEGPCRDHDEHSDEKVKAAKRAFVDAVRGGKDTLRSAAKKAGASEPTIWRWRRADPAFDREVIQAAGEVAADRLDAHEISLFSRAMKGELSAGLEIFWMLNMAQREAAMNQGGWRRWEQPAARHEVTGRDGGPVQSETTHHVMIYIPDNKRGETPSGRVVEVKEVASG